MPSGANFRLAKRLLTGPLRLHCTCNFTCPIGHQTFVFTCLRLEFTVRENWTWVFHALKTLSYFLIIFHAFNNVLLNLKN